MSTQEALRAGDALLEELTGGPLARPVSSAPTMGVLKRCNYTHDAMIDLIIAHPELNQGQIAAHFGYTESWISNILASDAFQAKMAARREELIDPELAATIKERFQALVVQSLKVLQAKLNQPQVSDQVAIRAAELGAKALGIGGHAPAAPRESSQDRLARLAERLPALLTHHRERTVNGEVLSSKVEPEAQSG